MSEEQPLQKSETTVTAVNSAPSGTAESKTDASSNSCAQVKVEARGYLLKKCRTNGDNKPWKKRFFVLHGSSLLYYRGDNMAGAHKVLVILASDYTIKQGDAPPWNAKEAIPITIMDSTGRTFSVAATDTQAYEYWMAALAKGRHLPPADLPDQEYKYARSSATLRLRIGLSAALASSSMGRSLLKRYLDLPTKELIRALLDHTQAQAGKKMAKSHEKGIFDIMARIAVIYHAGRLPPNLDLRCDCSPEVMYAQSFDYATAALYSVFQCSASSNGSGRIVLGPTSLTRLREGDWIVLTTLCADT
eukprot:m.1035502 g.1035502  ORF g.1035502 m.1035502 type:complete len:304 (+) comp24138_c3_seq5:284-1195(+)